MPRFGRPLEHIVVAITGASGSRYALRLIAELLRSSRLVTVLLSRAGGEVLHFETGHDWRGEAKEVSTRLRQHFASERVRHFAIDDLFAPVASGSSTADAVVIVPCSMGTAGRIAGGQGGNLIERSADVALKEQRPLLLVPRETPLHTIHLENLLRLARAGATIVPAMPAFYQRPASLEDLDAFMCGKILDLLGIDHALFPRWADDADRGRP